MEGFCNWGGDGTAAASVCSGGAQGGNFCNENQGNCENGCNGRWCTVAGDDDDDVGNDECPQGYKRGRFTSYTSFAECCPDNANYDSSASTDECDYYNACAYPGVFANVPRMTFEEVKSTNIVAFFATQNNDFYKNKIIRVLKDPSGNTSTESPNTVDSLIADTCGDSDCNGCCTSNASEAGGFLVDMEYWTVVNNFGSVSAASGKICWKIVEQNNLRGRRV